MNEQNQNPDADNDAQQRPARQPDVPRDIVVDVDFDADLQVEEAGADEVMQAADAILQEANANLGALEGHQDRDVIRLDLESDEDSAPNVEEESGPNVGEEELRALEFVRDHVEQAETVPRIHFDDTDPEPRRRSSRRGRSSGFNDLIRNARRQSSVFRADDDVRRSSTTGPEPCPLCHKTTHKLKDCPHYSKLNKAVDKLKRKHNLVIDGHKIDVRSTPIDADQFVPKKMWDKTNRPQSGDEKQAFTKEATGYVLSKTNKLSVPSFVQNDDGALKHVYHIQSQLASLRSVLYNCDMLDVFNIVVPYDVGKTADLRPETYDLFTDYYKLHPDQVANSCGWYNRWAGNSYIAENMALSFKLLENNMDSTLWTKCLEAYNEYPPMQQGGPLMLSLALRRIQDVSEDAFDNLKGRIRHLKLKDVPGENVDFAVSLIKSTYRALVAASTDERSFVPDDFPCTVLQVFQTTSVPEFNVAFAEEERITRREADKFGGIPNWPSITTITNLATSMYSRLKNKGDWVADAKTKKGAYNANGSGPPALPDSTPRPKRSCWNCGSPDHLLNDCDKPRDQAKIDAARKRFRAQNPRPPGPGGKARRKGAFHANGTKRKTRRKPPPSKKDKVDYDQSLLQGIRGLLGSMTDPKPPVVPPPADRSPSTPPAVHHVDVPATDSDVTVRAASIRALLRNIVNST